MKTKYLFGAIAFSLAFASCSEDMMDRINRDEAHPGINLNARLQLTETEVSTVYSTLCGNYAWYVSSFTEQLFGTGNNQLRQVEARNTSEVAGSPVFENEWNSTYLNLHNLFLLRNKCQEGGVNAGEYALLGMAQTLEALNWATLTDLHGDIPYKECFVKSAPKIDKQKEVYARVFELLDSAQINLARGTDDVSDNDILYKGKTDQWLAFVHALKARYLLRTYGTNKTNAQLQKVITEAQAALDGGFTGCELAVFNGQTADNSWYAYAQSREYTGCSSTVEKLLSDRNDPREPIYNYNKWGNNVVANPGDDAMASETEYVNWPAYLENGAAPLHVLSLSELHFILAEAKARLGLDATTNFESGVKASVKDFYQTGGSIIDKTISDSEIAAYLAAIGPRYTANPLKEILIQKYIAQSRDEQLETYNDIRRCRFIDGSYPVSLTNPNNTAGTANRWPLRLPYGNSDVVSNPNVAKAFGSGNDAGMYVYTQPVWWAGGN